MQIALEGGLRLQFTTLGRGDVSLHLSINSDRFGFDLTIDVGVLTDG